VRSEGAISSDNQILATYLHGIFDHPDALHALLQWAGLSADDNSHFDLAHCREQELERLADTVEAHMNQDWLDRLGVAS